MTPERLHDVAARTRRRKMSSDVIAWLLVASQIPLFVIASRLIHGDWPW